MACPARGISGQRLCPAHLAGPLALSSVSMPAAPGAVGEGTGGRHIDNPGGPDGHMRSAHPVHNCIIPTTILQYCNMPVSEPVDALIPAPSSAYFLYGHIAIWLPCRLRTSSQPHAQRAVGHDYLPSPGSGDVPPTANRPAALSTTRASVVTHAFERRRLVPPQSTSDHPRVPAWSVQR